MKRSEKKIILPAAERIRGIFCFWVPPQLCKIPRNVFYVASKTDAWRDADAMAGGQRCGYRFVPPASILFYCLLMQHMSRPHSPFEYTHAEG